MKKDRRDSETLGKLSYLSKKKYTCKFTFFNSYNNTKRTQNCFKMNNTCK